MIRKTVINKKINFPFISDDFYPLDDRA